MVSQASWFRDGNRLAIHQDGLRAEASPIVTHDPDLLPVDEEELAPASRAWTGHALEQPGFVAVDDQGDFFVTQNPMNEPALLHVQASTGDRVVISDSTTGSAPALSAPGPVAVETSGHVLIADTDLRAIFRVDPTTGHRTVLSGPSTGTGPALSSAPPGPVGVAVEPTGTIAALGVSMTGEGHVLRVDPLTGDRALFSGPTRGAGPAIEIPLGLVVEEDGSLIVSDVGRPASVRIDPTTGDRTTLTPPAAAPVPVLAIHGDAMLVRSPSDEPSRRSVTVRAREKRSADELVGDPTLAGAMLDVIANGAKSSWQTFRLAQGVRANGRPVWTTTKSGYRYLDSKGEQGPVSSIVIKKTDNGTFALSVKLQGKRGGLEVVPPNPGLDGGIILEIEGGARYCVGFGVDSRSTNLRERSWRIYHPGTEGCPVPLF